jgi:hypothetical protein
MSNGLSASVLIPASAGAQHLLIHEYQTSSVCGVRAGESAAECAADNACSLVLLKTFHEQWPERERADTGASASTAVTEHIQQYQAGFQCRSTSSRFDAGLCDSENSICIVVRKTLMRIVLCSNTFSRIQIDLVDL